MIGPLQIVLLSIVAAFTVVCGQNWFQTANQPVFTGMMAGIIMGDPVTGLFIGGSMQLTVLGIGTFGGSSHIDANSGAILATAFSVALGMGHRGARRGHPHHGRRARSLLQRLLPAAH